MRKIVILSNDKTKRERLFLRFQISRRRKVRVRVRPAAEDFVTAESQHFNSALNGLFRDQYKYDPTRQSKPFAPPEKSVLRNPFATSDILKNHDHNHDHNYPCFDRRRNDRDHHDSKRPSLEKRRDDDHRNASRRSIRKIGEKAARWREDEGEIGEEERG